MQKIAWNSCCRQLISCGQMQLARVPERGHANSSVGRDGAFEAAVPRNSQGKALTLVEKRWRRIEGTEES